MPVQGPALARSSSTTSAQGLPGDARAGREVRLSAKVRVTINGRTVEVPAGTLVTDAARVAEVHIPVFCSHPKLPPLGACRIWWWR
jgi:hypothetical protein